MNAFDVSSLERGRKVKVLDRSIVIPSYYELLDESPFGFHDVDEGNCPLAYGARSANALCAIEIAATPLEAAMPYDDVQYVLDFCREDLGEKQGVVEIDTGRTKGGYRYIYSIVKSDVNESEDASFVVVVYTLNLNIDFRDFTLSLVGCFQEDGMSGIRDNTVLMLMADMSGKSLSEVMDSGWFKDPYDPDWKMGFLMNASEKRMFDDAFPEHPLSMLRNLVSFIADNN